MKQCSKCGELKDDSLFSKDRNQCKECRKQYKKQYMKQYYQDHKEQRKQYCLDHKEEIKKRSEQYYLDTIVERKQYSKQYEMNHKEQRKQYRLYHKEDTKQYRIDHNEEIKQKKKQYRLTHKEERKQYHQSESGKIAQKKSDAKKRNMKYIQLMNNPFPEEISVDYHHILNNFHAIDSNNPWNKWFVIPIPKITHNFINGNTNNFGHWRHNEAWIQKLYCIDIKELLGIEKN